MISNKITKINILIEEWTYNEASTEIEKIESENKNLEKNEKLKLLQTKAKLFSKTLKTEEIFKVREKIISLLDTENKILEKIPTDYLELKNDSNTAFLWDINIWDIAKELSSKIKNQVSKQIFDSLIERLILEKIEENKNTKEISNIEEMYFSEIQIMKDNWEIGEAYFYESIYYNLEWDTEKEKEFIEKSALLWNKKAIEFYIDSIINIFLWNYNNLKTKEEKEKFLNSNLENIEEILFQFIDSSYFDKNNKKQKLVQWWNKYLYEKVWNFYSEIWLFSESLSSYTSWIQSGFEWSHKLYKNIAELYENFKHKIKIFEIEKINELIKNNYSFLYKYSGLVWDLENIVYWLEKLWDIEKWNDNQLSTKYYYKALNKIIEYNYIDYTSIISTTRLMEKLSLKELLLKYPDWNILVKIEKLYKEIAMNFDWKYLLSLSNHYEEIWNILWAYQNYLNAFQSNIEWSKDALLIFLKTSLVSYIEKESSEINLSLENEIETIQNPEEIKIIKQKQENNIEQLMFKKQLIKSIVRNIDQDDKILREQIAVLFDMSIWDSFYNNFEYKQLLIFIESYNQWINNSDIYLHRIIQNIFSTNGTNLNSPSIKKLLKKIYAKQKLSKNDINWIYNIINLENESG